MYVEANGTYSEQLRPFLPKIGVTPLADNKEFKQLLRDAGRKDSVMQRIQDEFFERRYFQPAMQWADANEFTLPLSALVIYDSFIHSGGIFDFLRKRFPEKVATKTPGSNNTWMSGMSGWRLTPIQSCEARYIARGVSSGKSR
jgi:chitosanase